jgi:cyclophilin family peptidyl-prolyl cis-trans isomerase
MFNWLKRPTRVPYLRRRPWLEQLEERCLLAAPVVDPIGNVTVPAGKSVVVPVTATDTDGNPLTYTATSDNSAVTVEVHSGNPFLKISVSEQETDGTLKSMGDMTFELFQDLTPNTVAQITKLVNAGFYNNLIFHRIIQGFVVQGGDPLGTGTGGGGFTFDDEFNSSLIYSGSGQLAMANSGKDSNSSQFFVSITNNTQARDLDFNNAIFGQLIRGSSVLTAINSVAGDANNKPLKDIVITSASIVTDTTDTVLIVKATSGSTAAAHITVTANDGHGGTNSQMFTATAAADTINDPANLGPIGDQTTPEGQAVNFALSGTDLENDQMTFEAVLASDSTNNATTSVSGNMVTVTPRAGFVGPIHLTVGVADMGATMRGSTADPFDTEAITVNVTSSTQAATTTTVTPSLTTAVFGQAVTYTATVARSGTGTGTPTGMVTFKEGNLLLGTAPLNSSGVATFSWTNTPNSTVTVITVGSHTITANYSGDANFSTSSGNAPALTVTPAGTTVTVASPTANPTAGKPLTLTATVTATAPGAGHPAGTVTFMEGTTTLGTAPVNDQGVATLMTPGLAAGSHTITANYPGDPKTTSSSGNGMVTVAAVIPPSNDTWLDAAYRLILGRPVDAVGESFFGTALDNGTINRFEIAMTLQFTQEFFLREIANLYQTLLNRSPDPSGQNTHLFYLSAGHTVEQTKAAIMGSDEYFRTRGSSSNSGFLTALFQDAVGRAVDSATSTSLTQLLTTGTSRTQVAQDVLSTPEAYVVSANHSYQQFLSRQGDQPGLNSAILIMLAGGTDAQIAAGLIGSDELFNMT